MSLEQMSKPELVKLARSTEQELKILKSEMEELKKEKEAETEVELELPHVAYSAVRVTKTLSSVVTIKFDTQNQAARVVNISDPIEHYKAQYKVDKLNATVAFKENKEGK